MKNLRWIAFVFFVLSGSCLHAQWLFTDLHPSWSNYSWVTGVSAGDQVGHAFDNANKPHAMRWQFSPSSGVDLGGLNSYAWATDGTKQVGYKGPAPTRWLNTPNSAFALRRPSHSTAIATTILNQTFGGYAWMTSLRSGTVSKALYWPSLTGIPVILPIPPEFMGSVLYAMSEEYKGGNVYFDAGPYYVNNAVVWEGLNNNFLNLNPYGYYSSTIRGISHNNIAVGWASVDENLYNGHAAVWDLWNGSFTDLHSYEHYSSVLWAISGSSAAGSFTDYNGYQHAAIYDVDSGSILDLHQFLPSHYTASEARAIWIGSGCGGKQVGGWAYSTIDQKAHAILWYTPFC